MSLLYPLLGVLVLIAGTFDLVWSTLSLAGGAPLSRWLGRGLWRLTGHASFAGPLILVATAVMWVGCLWVGWTLVFMAEPSAVVAASTGVPGGFWERVYFAGYAVATLGLGDYVPSAPLWRVLTVVMAFSGLVLTTIAVTYYLSVLGAAVQAQQLAALIRNLGDSPAAVVAGAWDGDGFPGLDTVLPRLASLIALTARRHYAYPVLHYFRPASPEDALSVQSARLSDALVLLGAVPEDSRPPPVALRLAQRSLFTFLDTLHPTFVTAASSPPPLPDLGPLAARDVPLEDAEAAFAADDVREKRRVLAGYVRDGRFRWRDVDPAAG